jgi:MinD-like ATPase involved in chromosome partitioning or flagellar assembly
VYQPLSLRLALGLGDQELEQRLRPALDTSDDLVVVAQCLAADQLLEVVESREVDAAIVAWSLHRLTDVVLEQLDRASVPIVLLVPDPHDPRWKTRAGPVLPLDADASTVRQVALAARRGGRVPTRSRPNADPVRMKTANSPEPRASSIIAVAGGMGSPGRTTVALNLAAALGAVVPTVLVEADLSAPALAAYLDRDPSRNLCTLAHAVREDPNAWSSALEDDLQPLSSHSRSAMLVCGPPKREMRASVAPAFFDRLVAELAVRFRYVVLDVGPELLGMDSAAANHRAALACAQQLLIVSAPDLAGLWHCRTALDQLERQLGIERASASLVLNRHDARYHHSRSEVEWHLGIPVAVVLPFDHAGVQRATAQQRPLVVDHTSRAARAILELAERLHHGRLRAPVADFAGSVSWWRRILPARGPRVVRRPMPAPEHLQAGASRVRRGPAW